MDSGNVRIGNYAISYSSTHTTQHLCPREDHHHHHKNSTLTNCHSFGYIWVTALELSSQRSLTLEHKRNIQVHCILWVRMGQVQVGVHWKDTFKCVPWIESKITKGRSLNGVMMMFKKKTKWSMNWSNSLLYYSRGGGISFMVVVMAVMMSHLVQ